MEWWNIVIPIVTLILGLVGGFFIGAFYLRKQLEKMQSDPEQLQKMAKQMGYNLNSKQMQKAQQMMKSQQFNRNQPGNRRNQGRRK
ncbi:YneF family protein [Paenibacillus terreus]|uniref:YneF family protein n=1 Tax=Paenibacillus terreus TaxID=1387834 RepID=A0ABV5BBB6_9BACL